MKVVDLYDDYARLPTDIEANLIALADTMTKFEAFYGKPLKVNSGYRTPQDHARIYENINDRRLLAGLDEIPIPMGSQHLKGKAVDVADSENDLQYWILDHLDVLEELELYCERFEFTKTWVHFQQVPPRSGRRFFVP